MYTYVCTYVCMYVGMHTCVYVDVCMYISNMLVNTCMNVFQLWTSMLVHKEIKFNKKRARTYFSFMLVLRVNTLVFMSK